MAEYIKREDVLRYCQDLINAEPGGDYSDERIAQTEEIAWYISHRPAADVVERKKGRWSWVSNSCSVCGLSKYNYISFNFHDPDGYARPFGTWNFCPHCGADMRGEDDEL